jgi:ABC-2 type transport system ATP-binding protein
MSNPTVQAEHLSKAFGAKQVLRDLSFNVMPGDVIGVLGKNGAGKTTLLELMLGFTPPTSGDIRVFGHASRQLPGAAKMRVGFVPQQDELLDALLASDQLSLIASFYPHWDQELVNQLCSAWNINLAARIKTLSVGERQKLSILLAFGQRPDLLVLDEPVASLDPIARRQFLEQLVELSTDARRAVVFSSHIVSDIERLANRIWILKEGQLYWQGELDALKESIVRLHVRAAVPLPARPDLPGLLSWRPQDTDAVAIAKDWTDQQHQALQQQLSCTIQVETLGLEEIFLELHR